MDMTGRMDTLHKGRYLVKSHLVGLWPIILTQAWKICGTYEASPPPMPRQT